MCKIQQDPYGILVRIGTFYNLQRNSSYLPFILHIIYIYNKLSTISIDDLHPAIVCTKFSLTIMYENPRPLSHKSIVTSVVIGQGQRLTSYSKKTHENLTNPKDSQKALRLHLLSENILNIV